MTPAQAELLKRLRTWRGFDPSAYLDHKASLINGYFGKAGLDSVVFGMSGGVDSAVVGALLAYCRSKPDSPIKRIVAVVAPIYTAGATNQSVAEERAIECCTTLGIEHWLCDLTQAQQHLENAVDGLTKATGEKLDWANGQILSITRTPIFYGVAAHLQAEGFKSLVSGTTNRSEGSYIGFYGKASDGMCDTQPISDIWKSEVYDIAKHLGIPDSIINEKPRGDVWDGRVDEEMIGAPYWFLELYLSAKCAMGYGDTERLTTLRATRTNQEWVHAIEDLHKQNKHKYMVGSPAVHFDVMPRYVLGGWSKQNTYTYKG